MSIQDEIDESTMASLQRLKDNSTGIPELDLFFDQSVIAMSTMMKAMNSAKVLAGT